MKKRLLRYLLILISLQSFIFGDKFKIVGIKNSSKEENIQIIFELCVLKKGYHICKESLNDGILIDNFYFFNKSLNFKKTKLQVKINAFAKLIFFLNSESYCIITFTRDNFSKKFLIFREYYEHNDSVKSKLFCIDLYGEKLNDKRKFFQEFENSISSEEQYYLEITGERIDELNLWLKPSCLIDQDY